MIALNSCAKSSLIVKSEYIKEKIPNELLEIKEFQLKEVKSEQEIITEFISLYSFYKDLKNKLEKIKALQFCENKLCFESVLEKD